jgi:creatinine amidohydrolase/Fe(II)-dependent formamide hydrolase-like protein
LLDHRRDVPEEVMAVRPGQVRMDLVPAQPVLPLGRFAHLRPLGIHNAHWWYADYPQQVVGDPSKATIEKGRKALEIMVTAVARALRIITDDQTAPALQREFLEKVKSKGK